MVNLSSQIMNFDLDLLRTFVYVDAYGSYSRAAEYIGCTQSAVTQKIQKLESQLGNALFEKHGRTKKLTTFGHHLLRHAQALLALNDDSMRTLQEIDSTALLRIGSPHDVADSILPQILSLIAKLMPNIRVDISIGRSPVLMGALNRGELDMTISTREDRSLEGFILRASPMLWICSANFIYTKGQPVPLIMGDEHSLFTAHAIDALRRHHMTWHKAYTSSNPIGIKAAVRAGLGITVRSMEMVGHDMRVLGEQEGLPRLTDVRYYLWMRPTAHNPVIGKVFSSLMQAYGVKELIS